MGSAEGGQHDRRERIPPARLRPPRARALPRARLLATLADTPHRLVLVTGPAGWGKTTLMAQFVAAAPDRPAAWYQLDAADARTPVLFGHLAEALAPAVPGLTGGWAGVEDAVAALDAVDPAALGPHGEVLLALDDLHLVAGSPGEEALGELLDLAPTWLRIAATCRQPPAWNLSRLRVSGDLLELGADDLRFRSWEVEQLFADLYGEPLPPGDVAQLTRGLEGWAAGLQLFYLATRGKPVGDRRRAVASLPARSKLIREYLTGNVLDELPEELRDFLVDTSVLGRLSPGLCDELRGRDDSRRLLDELTTRHVFLERLDEDGTYRYHEVFRTYLEERLLERDGPAPARAWAQRAARLLEDEGRTIDALRAYCRAEDWESVRRLLDTAGAELVDRTEPWLDWLPSGLIEGDPWALLAAARRAAQTGRFATALDLYAQAEEVAGTAAAAEICRIERTELTGWIDPAAPPPSGTGGRFVAALRARPGHYKTVPTGIEVHGPYAPRALVAGVAAIFAGDLRTATRLLVATVDDPEAHPYVAMAARMSLGVVRLLGGDVDQATVLQLPELMELADVPWLTWMASAARGLAGDAAGWRDAMQAAETMARQGDPWGSAAARLFASLGALVAGGHPVDELEELADHLKGLRAHVPEAWARAWLATASARAGAPVRASEVATAAEQAAERVGAFGAQVWALTVQAQLAAAEGDEDRAASLLERAAKVREEGPVDVVVAPLVPGDAPVRAPARERASRLPRAGAASEDEGAASDLRIDVRCLGAFSLEIDGRVVDVGAAKPRARSTLRLLAAHAGQPVHVETLIDALWPDSDAAVGKRSLQVTLSSLRRLLDGHHPGAGALLARQGNAYVLELPPGSSADVVAFADARERCRVAARQGEVTAVVEAGEEALAAYGGDLLPEEGPAEWVVAPRRQLAQDAAGVAVLVAERWDVAVGACQRGLDIDRYSDALWRLLALAHERAGDIAAAAAAREGYQAILDDLGVDADLGL
ncbi:MAG TPA: winged helix-turn-helix domain-containing protein [Acidimicrobiales bacterium]